MVGSRGRGCMGVKGWVGSRGGEDLGMVGSRGSGVKRVVAVRVLWRSRGEGLHLDLHRWNPHGLNLYNLDLH